MSARDPDKTITVIVPNAEVSKEFVATFKRIAGLMGAVRVLTGVINGQDEDLPEDEIAGNIGPELTTFALSIVNLYPNGPNQMLQDLAAVQSMLDHQQIRKES